MSTKVILLASIAILSLLIWFLTDGIKRVVFLLAFFCFVTLGIAFWTGALTWQEFVESIQKAFNA